jgi:hypothetical protein
MSGEIKYTKGCGACWSDANSMATSCTGEYGPEWAYDGFMQGCGACKFNCVSFGLLGTACTDGTHAKCKHVAYLGDQTACCLGKKDTGGTCAPAYNISGGGCDSIMQTYCSEGDKIIKDPKCIEWTNTRPDVSKQTVRLYCLANLDKEECREWCSYNKIACDDAVSNWCATNINDPYCSCINSPLTDAKFGINPACNDRKCIDTGYITTNMEITNCPDVTNCEIQSQLLNSGVSLAGVTINQECGKKEDSQPVLGTGRSTVGEAPKLDKLRPLPTGQPVVQPTIGQDYTIYIFVLLFIFVVLIAVAGFLIYRSRNTTV